MHLKSRSHASDAALARFDGEVREREDYVVISTPSNPSFYWGNFIVFSRPPRGARDCAAWREIHARELGEHPERATIFAWDEIDGATGDDAAFLAAGMSRDLGWCMSARDVVPNKNHDPALRVRPLATEPEWQSAETCLAAAFSAKRAGDRLVRNFVRQQLIRYRAMAAAGVGVWFGAFEGERVIGACGLVRQGEVARFQLVGTDPAHVRRGVCSTLLYHAGRFGLDVWGARELLIVADAHAHAKEVYRSLGFEVVERLATLIKLPEGAV